MTTITCLVCGKVLEPVVTDITFYGEMEYAKDVPNVQPYDGVVFTATGNFGSTVYDPVGGENALIAVICDECLLAHQDRFYTVPGNTEAVEGPCILCDGDGVLFVVTPIPGGDVEDVTEEEVPCPCCGGHRAN